MNVPLYSSLPTKKQPKSGEGERKTIAQIFGIKKKKTLFKFYLCLYLH